MNPEALATAQHQARKSFPQVICGAIINGAFVPLRNAAADPTKTFAFLPEDLDYLQRARPSAVAFSRTDGQITPHESDMRLQQLLGVPFALIPANGVSDFDVVAWGDALPIAPLEGRRFIYGVHDCFNLVRDTLRSGIEGMAANGFYEWSFAPVALPQVAYEENWEGRHDHYSANLQRAGFYRIKREQVRVGDCFLMSLASNKLNHAGIVVGEDRILHHKPGRLSAAEPMGLYYRGADLWLRKDLV